MCILERKTYIHSDGPRIIETPRLCPKAVGSRPCGPFELRTIAPVNVVETRPAPIDRHASDRILLTEGFNGRQNRYREVSIRSSSSSQPRHSRTRSDRSSFSVPSSASSPSIREVKPRAPTPPPAALGYPFRASMDRSEDSFPPPLSPPLFPTIPPTAPPDPTRIVTKDGTAIYARPPSLEFPRALDNERPRPSTPKDEPSAFSTKDEVVDRSEPALSQRRRRESFTIDTTLQRPTSSTSSSSRDAAPSKSDKLPRRSSLRHDPAVGSSRDKPKNSKRPVIGDSSRSSTRDKTNPTKRPVVEDSRATREVHFEETQQQQQQETEDQRQARLERGRLAETDRRQPARDASRHRQDHDRLGRDRHRRDTTDIPKGTLPRPSRTESIDQNIAADRAQMEREKVAADARRRESEEARRFSTEYVVRDPVGGHVRYVNPSSPLMATRPEFRSRNSVGAPVVVGGGGGVGIDPLSSRLVRNPTVMVHQQQPPPPPPSLPYGGVEEDFSPRRRRRESSNSFRDWGAEVVERERARVASERLSDAVRRNDGRAAYARDEEPPEYGDDGFYDGEDDRGDVVIEVHNDYEVVIGPDGRRYRRYRRSNRERRDGGGRGRSPPRFHR